MKIAVIGGHITPAFAMMDELVTIEPEVQFVFFGRMHTREGDSAVSTEYQLVTKKNIRFISITTGRLYRNLNWNAVRSLSKVPIGFAQSFFYLLRERPSVVCSFGSYLAVPVVICAWILRIPVITHEQTLIPGVANKIISRFASCIALSFEDTRRFYTHARTEVTGNPIRKEVFERKNDLVISKGSLPVVYITGGNQGAHGLNVIVFNALQQLLSFAIVIHQTGNSVEYKDYDHSIVLKKHLDDLAERYLPYEYVGPELIGDVFGYSDVVVSRAGINTLCELWTLGKKGIIFPITHLTHAEQEYNAQFFEKSGFGVSLRQEATSSDQFVAAVKDLLARELSVEALQRGRDLVHPDASRHLAQLVVSCAEKA